MYLSGVRWWGKKINVKPSMAQHVKLARAGEDVSNVTIHYLMQRMLRSAIVIVYLCCHW